MDSNMIKQIRNVAGAAALGATVLFSPATSALAQPQNGLVNVNVEGNEILNENRVGIGVAANVLAQVCTNLAGVQVGVIARQLQAIDEPTVVCQSATGPVTVSPVVN